MGPAVELPSRAGIEIGPDAALVRVRPSGTLRRLESASIPSNTATDRTFRADARLQPVGVMDPRSAVDAVRADNMIRQPCTGPNVAGPRQAWTLEHAAEPDGPAGASARCRAGRPSWRSRRKRGLAAARALKASEPDPKVCALVLRRREAASKDDSRGCCLVSWSILRGLLRTAKGASG